MLSTVISSIVGFKELVIAKLLTFAASLNIGQYLNPDTCPDYVKNSKLGSTAIALLDYTSFLQSGVKALKVVIIAVGGGLAVLGVVNLLEGYGNDNPGAKSQGMKQFMAGAGVMLIGALLVPKLSDLIPSTL
ncbi:MAG: Maff2 family protein [Eubacterium sp.]|nr:Maff2 family protein [Eubacterium sp.]